MRYPFIVNILEASPNEYCFFCNEPLTTNKVQIFYQHPDSRNALVVDYPCWEQMIALGIKVLWKVSPASLDSN
jgi:hypothetical protein